ncbi:MAG TPA: hypothetical protein VF184_06290, partial [Phycisphaeraceae bacterium]
ARFWAQAHYDSQGTMDVAQAQMQWDDGALASFTASFLTPPGMADDGFDRMEVAGEGWMARLEPNPRPIQWWDERARWPMGLEILAGGGLPAGMLARELRCFCRVVRRRQAVPAGARYADALQVMRWLERLRQIVAGQSAGAEEVTAC